MIVTKYANDLKALVDAFAEDCDSVYDAWNMVLDYAGEQDEFVSH